jgi:hypothetical protein
MKIDSWTRGAVAAAIAAVVTAGYVAVLVSALSHA